MAYTIISKKQIMRRTLGRAQTPILDNIAVTAVMQANHSPSSVQFPPYVDQAGRHASARSGR